MCSIMGGLAGKAMKGAGAAAMGGLIGSQLLRRKKKTPVDQMTTASGA